jgi:4-amino-4-deoxy-L-arabinose transferase-like glycosyltransferase
MSARAAPGLATEPAPTASSPGAVDAAQNPPALLQTRIERLRDRAPDLALIAVIVLAFALRSYSIETNPPELFEDEIAPAASAWSIVTTGHDVETTRLPFFVTRLAYLPPIYGYATLPYQAILGHTVQAVRIPAILFGTLTTWLLYWIARVLGRRRWEAVLAAFLFAVTPWAVHYGRLGFDPASTLPFVVAGVGLLWDGLARSRPGRIVVAGVLLALGAYSYTPALMLDVLLALLVVAILAGHPLGRAVRLQRRDLTGIAVAAVAAGVVLVPYLLAFADPLFTHRTAIISVFHDGVNLSAVSMAWNHYWAQWDPTYLFLRGTANLRNEPGMGVLLPITAPFLVVGVVASVVRRRAADLLIIGWLILGPLAAALTDDGVPHFLRGIYVLPAIVLVTARGCVATWDWIGDRDLSRRAVRRVGAAVLAVAVTVQIAITFGFYFGEYPRVSALAWRFGMGEALALVRDTVPEGGTACLDPGALSYWTFPHIVAWHLPSSPFTVVEGTTDPRCAEPGSYLLAHPGATIPSGAVPVGQVEGADPNSPFILYRVGP